MSQVIIRGENLSQYFVTPGLRLLVKERLKIGLYTAATLLTYVRNEVSSFHVAGIYLRLRYTLMYRPIHIVVYHAVYQHTNTTFTRHNFSVPARYGIRFGTARFG